jgi:DNA-binding MarR family transcriptional regulator
MALNTILTRLPTALGVQLQRDSGLTYLEYHVLAYLSDQPDRALPMSQLAVLTNAELSRLSHLISRLEKRGLVQRQPNPTDGRITIATLTHEGQALLDRAAPEHVKQVRELVFDALDKETQHALRYAAHAIVNRLDDGDCAPGAP